MNDPKLKHRTDAEWSAFFMDHCTGNEVWRKVESKFDQEMTATINPMNESDEVKTSALYRIVRANSEMAANAFAMGSGAGWTEGVVASRHTVDKSVRNLVVAKNSITVYRFLAFVGWVIVLIQGIGVIV